MALTAKTAYIHPQNWDGNLPTIGGWKKVILHLTAICSATGTNTDESDVVKLDISSLRKTDGTAPTRTVVKKVNWAIGGFNNVKLSWDRAPSETIITMSGYGNMCNDIVDPGEAGESTGDILLSTYGAATGAVYSIELEVKLK